MIQGVQGLDDDITVNQPQASATDIATGIAAAFARNAEAILPHALFTKPAYT